VLSLVSVLELDMRLSSAAEQLRKIVAAPYSFHQMLGSLEESECCPRTPELALERALVAVGERESPIIAALPASYHGLSEAVSRGVKVTTSIVQEPHHVRSEFQRVGMTKLR